MSEGLHILIVVWLGVIFPVAILLMIIAAFMKWVNKP